MTISKTFDHLWPFVTAKWTDEKKERYEGEVFFYLI